MDMGYRYPRSLRRCKVVELSCSDHAATTRTFVTFTACSSLSAQRGSCRMKEVGSAAHGSVRGGLRHDGSSPSGAAIHNVSVILAASPSRIRTTTNWRRHRFWRSDLARLTKDHRAEERSPNSGWRGAPAASDRTGIWQSAPFSSQQAVLLARQNRCFRQKASVSGQGYGRPARTTALPSHHVRTGGQVLKPLGD